MASAVNAGGNGAIRKPRAQIACCSWLCVTDNNGLRSRLRRHLRPLWFFNQVSLKVTVRLNKSRSGVEP